MQRNALIPLVLSTALAAPLAAYADKHGQHGATMKDKPAATAGTQAAQKPVALRASDLIGKQVVNAQGKELGEVQDLAVDLRNNRIHYAMLDMQNKMFAYPMSSLSLSKGGDKVLLNVSEDRLEKAPGMDRSMAERRTQGTGMIGQDYEPYWREADTYWGAENRRGAADPALARTPGTRTDPTPGTPAVRDGERKTAQATGPTTSVKPRENMQLVWASKLVGWNLHGRANEDSIGEVKDLVINPGDGKVKFAAVDFNDKIGGPNAKAFDEKLHAVPLNAMTTREGKDDLVLQVDAQKMKPNQGFAEDQLERGITDRNFIDKTSNYVEGLVHQGAQKVEKATRN